MFEVTHLFGMNYIMELKKVEKNLLSAFVIVVFQWTLIALVNCKSIFSDKYRRKSSNKTITQLHDWGKENVNFFADTTKIFVFKATTFTIVTTAWIEKGCIVRRGIRRAKPSINTAPILSSIGNWFSPLRSSE